MLRGGFSYTPGIYRWTVEPRGWLFRNQPPDTDKGRTEGLDSASTEITRAAWRLLIRPVLDGG
jgi:hypothetical protein